MGPGTWRPANFEFEIFPGPAPSQPYQTNLSVFRGTDPNGVWRLYVADDFYGEGGSLEGWSLDLATVEAACCGEALPTFTAVQVAGGEVGLEFTTTLGRYYFVERTGQLGSVGAWQPVPGAALVPGTGAAVRVVDRWPATHRGFYRVRVWP